MITYIFLFLASLFTTLLPVAGLATVIFLANANKSRSIGFLHLIPYCMLLVIAGDVLFSGRVVNDESFILQNELTRSPISGWMIRICTVLMITASLERIVNFITVNKHPFGRHPLLMVSFITFWLGSVGFNAFFSAHPSFSHEYVYSLVIGIGLLTLSRDEINLLLISLRNAFFLFLIASFLLVFINPLMVMQTTYIQGYIPGLPRMAGLAPHAVTFGVLILIFLTLAIKVPFKSNKLQKLAYFLAILALVLAQSKTVWVTMFQVFSVLAFFKLKTNLKGTPLLKSQSILVLIVTSIFLLCSLVIIAIAGGVIHKVTLFLDSKEGAQLLTLTGRDIIWDFALSEWAKYPWFGYGPSFLNFDHRASIGLLNATHAHNQFVDLLARSGLISLITSIFYLLVILILIFNLKDDYRDLAIVAFLIVINRCVSEVPLSLYGYGHEFLIQIFMLAPLLLQEKQKNNSPLKIMRQ